MALADIQTLQFNIPTVQVLRLAVQSGRARRVEALRVAEAAWDKYNAAVDAGDPSARYLGDLAEAADLEALEAWRVMDAAEGLLLSMLN